MKSVMGNVNGFELKLTPMPNDWIRFKVRKRNTYHTIYHNNIVASGTATRTGMRKQSHVEISFRHHFITLLYVFAYLGLGVLGIVSGIISNTYMSWFGVVLLVIGLLLLIEVQRSYRQNIRQYKILLSDLLGA